MRAYTSWNELLRPGQGTEFFRGRPLPEFDPGAMDFSAANAVWLAELSRLVYRPDIEEEDPAPIPTRRVILRQVGLTQRAFFSSAETDSQAMLVERASDPQFTVLVFRGTEQKLKDFITDLRIGTDALVGDDYALHEGFKQAFESIWPQIEPELETVTGPLFFTGHSLGGALATLAAARRPPTALYTFGCPRVGNARFAERLDGQTIFRVVDDWDVVSALPPEALGFRHVGKVIHLIEPGVKFTINPLAWLKLMFSPAKPLADHAPVNYVKRLTVESG